MRCKPDELAVISYTPEPSPFNGLLVQTIRLAKDGDFGMHYDPRATKFGPFWIVSFAAGRRPPYPKHDGNMPSTLGVWPDAWLRPIRDDGSLFDETMFWVKRHARA